MTGPGLALRLAFRDLYENSWRFVPVNAALGTVLVAVGVATFAVRAALVLVVVAGPIAAALVHSAVTLVRTGDVELRDALAGLRLHWRRGLALGAGGSALLGLGVVAVRFYARTSYGWPLVFATVYLLVLLGVFQLVLWTLAIAEPDRPLRLACRDAAALAARRPGAALVLGLALLLVNAAGVAVAVMPFLTLTVAYSFVAAARFALPNPTSEESA
jgi:hypothetical protein